MIYSLFSPGYCILKKILYLCGVNESFFPKIMNRILLKMVLPIAFTQLFSGCVTYFPQVVDVPLIKEKGDIRIDAGAFLIPNINDKTGEHDPIANFGIHATVTAGITDFLAVQSYLSINALSRYHIQSALGLFNRLNNNTVTEVYGGVGYGNGNISYAGDYYYLTFVQFNLGKTDLGRSHIDYGLGMKGGYLFTNTVDMETIYKKDGWMIEPTVFIRFGGRRAKFCAKVNYLWTKTIIDNYYFPVSVGLGVNFHAGKK